MSYIHFGSTLKHLRKQQKMGRERLAYGIMPAKTLKKIERGKYLPTKDMVDMLLSRLGVSTQVFAPQYMDRDAFEADLMCRGLKHGLNNYRYRATEKLLRDMGEMPQFAGGTMRQTYLHGIASVCFYKDKDSKGALKYLREAIQITLPNFEEDEVSTYMLGDKEIDIIISISNVHEHEGKRDKAIVLLEQLVYTIKTSEIDMHEKARSLAHVLYNLTSKLNRASKYAEALELCDEAITICEAHLALELLPVLKFNKASNLFFLEEREEVRDLVYQAYYGSLTNGDNFFAKAIKERASEDFGIVIE